MIDYIMEYTAAIAEILLFCFYFKGVLGEKENAPIPFYFLGAGMIVFNILRSFWYLPFEINICVTIGIWAVIALVGCGGSVPKKLFFIAMQTIALMVTEVVTATFLSMQMQIEYDDGFSMRYLGMIMTIAILFVIDLYIIYLAKKKFRHLPIKYNIMLLLCPGFSAFLLMLLDVYITQSQNVYYGMTFLAVAGLGYINIMILDFFDYYEKGLQTAALEAMLKANETNYRLLEENEKELHILRHDILKHMSAMQAMLEEGNREKAVLYAEELSQLVSEGASVARSGNITLDTVLNLESKKAVALGIRYDIKLHLEEEIRISAVDLSAMLYNAIDNAIEASQKTEEKYVLVSVRTTEGKVFLTVENVTEVVQLKNGKIKTTKSDEKHHGYGLKSIRTALKKYNGTLTLSCKNGIFTCEMCMRNGK